MDVEVHVSHAVPVPSALPESAMQRLGLAHQAELTHQTVGPEPSCFTDLEGGEGGNEGGAEGGSGWEGTIGVL